MKTVSIVDSYYQDSTDVEAGPSSSELDDEVNELAMETLLLDELCPCLPDLGSVCDVIDHTIGSLNLFLMSCFEGDREKDS